MLLYKTKPRMCRDLIALCLLNLPAGTGSAHALGALLSQNAHGGDKFSLVVELVTGATLAEACLRGKS